MRVTLNIDDDVLVMAKSIAACQHKTLGNVISALVRKALHQHRAVRNGIPLLHPREGATRVTPELISQFTDTFL